MLKIGFLGGGCMANALAKGFMAAGLAKAENIIASVHPSDLKSATDFKALGAEAIFENIPVVDKSNVVVISVKPHIVPTVLKEVYCVNNIKEKLFISIAMGVTLRSLEEKLPGCRVVRVMPNTGVMVRTGAAVLSPGTKANPQDLKLVQDLFSAVGTCDQAPESMLDAVTALSGSGPAYAYMLIEAMADGGVKMGLPRDLAQRLAAQTVAGAGKMVIDQKVHPAQLRDNVTSPGGSTAAALHHLEKCAFRGAVVGAVEAATEKCRQVAAKE
ncbi:pyrroline-5-carboxylate reductase-like 2 [Arctopsyche grandis]|uniref:pyrroline-5-carboxylate reductase-like 2 n=1 Tax=Arctopsyche grandis TaxID=121162 RepID=UPI00406D72B9